MGGRVVGVAPRTPNFISFLVILIYTSPPIWLVGCLEWSKNCRLERSLVAKIFFFIRTSKGVLQSEFLG